MPGLEFMLNCVLPAKLLTDAWKEMQEHFQKKDECPMCLAGFFVATNAGNPQRPMVVRMSDRKRVPIVSTLEERLQVLGEDNRVEIELLPAPKESVTYVSGRPESWRTFAVNLPDYNPERVLLVYQDVLDWVERRTTRPLDDLMSFDDVRMVEEEDGCYTIGCRKLLGAVRHCWRRQTLVLPTEEMHRQIVELRQTREPQCPGERQVIDLVDMMDEMLMEQEVDEYFDDVLQHEDIYIQKVG